MAKMHDRGQTVDCPGRHFSDQGGSKLYLNVVLFGKPQGFNGSRIITLNCARDGIDPSTLIGKNPSFIDLFFFGVFKLFFLSDQPFCSLVYICC